MESNGLDVLELAFVNGFFSIRARKVESATLAELKPHKSKY